MYLSKFNWGFKLVEAILLISCVAGREKFIVDELKRYKNVSEAYGIMGSYDVIAIVEGTNLQALDSFITENVRIIPYVTITSTLISCATERCAND